MDMSTHDKMAATRERLQQAAQLARSLASRFNGLTWQEELALVSRGVKLLRRGVKPADILRRLRAGK